MKDPRFAAALFVFLFSSGCGGHSPSGPTPVPGNQAPQALALQVWTVKSYRRPGDAGFFYEVTYRFRNTFSEPVTVSIAEAHLTGPSGESLDGFIRQSDLPPPRIVEPGVYTQYDDVMVSDSDARHPYAERVRLTASYYGSTLRGTAEAAAEVLHPPLTLPPPESTPPPRAPESGAVSVRLSELLVIRPQSAGSGARIRYSACGQISNVGGNNLVIRRMELAVSGPDGEHYPIEQGWSNLTPRKYAPGGTSFGCGIAEGADPDVSRRTPAQARLIVHYSLDDGLQPGSVEASTSSIR